MALVASAGRVGLTSSAGVYNPWYDLDDDGDIDIFDVVRMAGSYSTSGTPFTMKAAPAYNSGGVDIRDKRGQTITFYPNVGNLETLRGFRGCMGAPWTAETFSNGALTNRATHRAGRRASEDQAMNPRVAPWCKRVMAATPSPAPQTQLFRLTSGWSRRTRSG
jgi:hypothetical protein